MIQQIYQRTKESSKKSWKKIVKVQTPTPMASICKKERNVYNRLLIYHKKQTISKKINESMNDTKQQFHFINNINMSKTAWPPCQKEKWMHN